MDNAKGVKIGVVALQGDVSEHIEAGRAALARLGKSAAMVQVRRPRDMEEVGALILPGGESTTISKLLRKFGLTELVRRRASEGMPLMGTCAGCILMASEGDEQVDRTETELLGLMDMAVDRNAFGRQHESFEADLQVEGLGKFRGVFIRAPAITRTWGGCRPLARLEGAIVMARQGHLMALAFHPELTGDPRIHEVFLRDL